MSVSVGQTVRADDFNQLFNRIEVVRARHANTAGQTGALATTYSSTRVTAGAPARASDVTNMNNALNNLSNSIWINTTFTSGITIPSVGSLLQASLYNSIDSKISTIEGLCANCSHFSPNFTTAASNGDFSTASRNGNFSSDFTTAARNGNYTSTSNQGNFGNNFTTAAQNGNFQHDRADFGTAASLGNYTTAASKGNFTTNFTTAAQNGNYTSNFGSNFTTAARNGNYTSAASKGNFTSNFTTTARKGNYTTNSAKGNFSTTTREATQP